MAVYRYKDRIPKIGKGCYVAETATVIGDVTLGDGCYVGPGAVIRGDYGTVVIGKNTAVEENVVIHARPAEVCTIGDMVTIGHGAIVHNVTMIHEGAVIGMGAVVSDWAEVGEWAAVAEGALVKNKQKIPPRAIAVGVPATIKGEVSDEWIDTWRGYKMKYVELASSYAKDIERID